MEPVTEPVVVEPQSGAAEEPNTAGRLELLAEELRDAIRRKLRPRD